MKNLFLSLSLICLVAAGCNKSQPIQQTAADEKYEVFTQTWSEYPSWSIISVAGDRGLFNPAQGGTYGPIEKKWKVDIVLKEADYDSCITSYGTGTSVQASCLTNIDAVAPSRSRETVFILPTSTSAGADAVIVQSDLTLDDLKKNETRGLEKSVSQYVFERNLALKGLDAKEFPFKNLDPGAAATALQTKQENINSICVWNPFSLQTLRTRKDVKVLFDSSTLKEEVIDGIVVGKDVLKTDAGQRFACALIDAYYEINKQLANKETHDEVLKEIGAKFFDLGVQDMETIITQTKFYTTPESALALLKSDKFRKETTPTVIDFCISHDLIQATDLPAGKKQVAFDKEEGGLLTFTTEYIERVQARNKE